MRTRFYLFLVIYSLFAIGNIQAQNSTGDNPFELTPRLKEKPVTKITPEAEEKGNPFELITPEKEKSVVKAPIVPKKVNPTEEAFGNNSFLLGVILFGLLAMAVLVTSLRPFLVKCYRAVLNENMLNQIYRERETGLFLPYFLLYILFFLHAGTFLFLLLKFAKISFAISPLLLVIGCVLFVALLFFLKHLILAVVGAIFPIKREVSIYSFTIMVYSIMLGMGLAPANLMIAYAPTQLISILIVATLIMIVLLYTVRAFRGLLLANNYLRFHIFHFLLYICTVEIVPVLVLYKMITNQLA